MALGLGSGPRIRTAGLWIPPGAHRLEAILGRVSTPQGSIGWQQQDRCAPLLCSRRSALHCRRQPLKKGPALIPKMQLSCAVVFCSAELAGAVRSAELAMALEHTSGYRDNIPNLLPDLVGAPLFPGPRGTGCHNIYKYMWDEEYTIGVYSCMMLIGHHLIPCNHIIKQV